ncbi:MAG TPA: proline-rich domain-containing protein [Candidatus Acidoferrales bacterium]|nr:proline-rich domain-containing protein [Candidatus Acidoferrales bacterium]
MRKINSLFILSFLIAGLFAALPKPAAAQDDDPPGRVARLNYTQGSVSYQVSGDKDWVQADPNRPLTTGDNLWVDENSRGEVHIGSTAIRLSSQTGLSFLTLDDRTVQLQLAQGTIEVHLRHHLSGDAFEIDTPNLAFTLSSSGEYRIQTDPDGNSTVIVVREGGGQVTGGGESWELRGGQQYQFNGTDQLSYDAMEAPGFDDFEDWCQSRDQRENGSASARYVSRDVDGYYDLDEYGDWHDDPDYGAVWIPRGVAAGWAPYHYGHWVYVAPWGWTWVDEEPWGFAPFHYGRWAFVGGYWAWVPGPVVVRPVYAPALVGFVGGRGFGIAVSFGGGFSGVAWFPLGPRDVYVPGYRCSPRYVQNVNITNTRVVNVTQVTNVYNNVYINRNTTVVNHYTYERNEAAVTAVSKETFVNARSVSRASVRVTADQMNHARVVDSAPVVPTRTSFVSATAKISTATPKVPFAQRPVVARLNPAVSRPAPVVTNDSRGFNRQQTNQQQAARGDNTVQPPTFRGGNNNPQPPASGSNTQQPRNGFHPFQPPAGKDNNPPVAAGNNPPAQQNRNAGNTFNWSQDRSVQHPQPQYEPRPAMKFAPPPKARDDMYDVHPPLNQRQAQPPNPQKQLQPAPKQEERRPPPPPEKNNNKSDEKHSH